MKKGIEAFKRIKENTTCYVSQDYDMTNYDADVEVVEKELKTLEIIKKKRINVDKLLFMIKDLKMDYEKCKNSNKYEFYHTCGSKDYITQEEFDLLKKVLKP